MHQVIVFLILFIYLMLLINCFFLLQQHDAENTALHQHAVGDRARRMFAAHAGRRLYYAAEERHRRRGHCSVFAVPVVRGLR